MQLLDNTFSIGPKELEQSGNLPASIVGFFSSVSAVLSTGALETVTELGSIRCAYSEIPGRAGCPEFEFDILGFVVWIKQVEVLQPRGEATLEHARLIPRKF
jgi:hypothetical protein